MSTALLVLQLVEALVSAYDEAQQDGTAAAVQTALADLVGEFSKPETQTAMSDAKNLISGVK